MVLKKEKKILKLAQLSDSVTPDRGTGLSENMEGPAHTAGQLEKQEQDLEVFTSLPHDWGLCSLWDRDITFIRSHL